MSQRQQLYLQLEALRESRVLTYFTSDRKGLETQIGEDALDILVQHLNHIGVVDRLSLILHTRGGSTMAAWSMLRLLQAFAKEVELIVPIRALSAGTLIGLGAKRILMTRQAMLGPIDPNINNPLNPQVELNGQKAAVSVNVEELNAYVAFARQIVGEETGGREGILSLLGQHIHPLALGQAYRGRSQLRAIAKKLLDKHIRDPAQAVKTLEFLSSESGSHDYGILRDEARDELGLKVEDLDAPTDTLVREIYNSVAQELELTRPYSDHQQLGGSETCTYTLPRVVMETVGKRHAFRTEGTITRVMHTTKLGPTQAFLNSRTFEGWREESV